MMEKAQFRKKYLGEVTLKNGQHVKFLYPLTELDVFKTKIESENIYNRIHKSGANVKEYDWAIYDDLDLAQFRIAYAAVAIYGKRYWKLTWEQMCKK